MLNPRPTLKVALVSPWNTIHPGLQHTLVGDLVLSNQFEALVGLNENDVSVPLGAKSWEFSDDFRVFKFVIDTSRTFSDGSHLSARDFKRSWEDAARLEPVSANSSLLDVLYKIEGFDKLKERGEITGLKAPSDDLLEITFATPFRMALEHLQGCRFAAYKETSGGFIGTGVYRLSELGTDHLLMKARQEERYAGVPDLDVHYIPADQAIADLAAGKIDVIHYLSGNAPNLEKIESGPTSLLVGQDSVHLGIGLNSSVDSLFAKRDFRQAFLYLVNQAIQKNRGYLPAERAFREDVQFLMPFQAGRINAEDAKAIVDAGRVHVDALKAATEKHPLLVKAGIASAGILNLIEATGLKLDPNSGTLATKDYIALGYAPRGPDVLVRAFSVASGDPDGLYHVLGKNGAIRTPYIYSESVSQLLEEGRRLTAIDQLDSFYQKVSRALLTEAPMIHLGFARALTAYRNDRVTLDTTVLRRNQGQMHFLRARQ